MLAIKNGVIFFFFIIKQYCHYVCGWKHTNEDGTHRSGLPSVSKICSGLTLFHCCWYHRTFIIRYYYNFCSGNVEQTFLLFGQQITHLICAHTSGHIFVRIGQRPPSGIVPGEPQGFGFFEDTASRDVILEEVIRLTGIVITKSILKNSGKQKKIIKITTITCVGILVDGYVLVFRVKDLFVHHFL